MAFQKISFESLFRCMHFRDLKLGYLNLDMNQFTYSEWRMHSKRHQKGIIIWHLKKILQAVFFKIHTSENWNWATKFGHQSFFLYWTTNAFKNASKWSFYMVFKEIIRAIFTIHTLPRLRIGLSNLDIHKFSYSEWQIHSKSHLKRCLSIEVK